MHALNEEHHGGGSFMDHKLGSELYFIHYIHYL